MSRDKGGVYERKGRSSYRASRPFTLSEKALLDKSVVGKRVVVVVEPLSGNQFFAKRLIVLPDLVPQGM